MTLVPLLPLGRLEDPANLLRLGNDGLAFGCVPFSFLFSFFFFNLFGLGFIVRLTPRSYHTVLCLLVSVKLAEHSDCFCLFFKAQCTIIVFRIIKVRIIA